MTEQQIWVLPFGERPELDFHSDWGVVSVVPIAPGEEPRLEVSEGGAERVDVRVLTNGGAVRVELEPRGAFSWLGTWGGWDARVTLHVPPAVVARLETGAGSITARDLEGCALALKTNAGKIELERIRGALRLSADAGSINGRDVSGRFDVQTEAGSIRLDILGLEPGEHVFRASMGSIRVDLAKGLDVQVNSRTSLGSTRNTYPSRDGAPIVLGLSTEMGSVRVQEGAFGARPSHRSGSVPNRADGTRSGDARTGAASAQAPDAAAAAPDQTQPQTLDQTPTDSDLELERILKMVEAGRLSAKEADDLLRAMGRI